MEKHVMIDIETLGTKSYSVILSIAAVEFNLETGETGKDFFTVIDIQSCIDWGLTFDGDTIRWWLQQNNNAKEHFRTKGVNISSALVELERFIRGFNIPINKLYVWGNSHSFDCALIANAFEKIDIPLPWMYYNERCVRTVSKLFPDIKKQTTFIGTHHHPLHDCYYQIEYLCATYKKIKSIN